MLKLVSILCTSMFSTARPWGRCRVYWGSPHHHCRCLDEHCFCAVNCFMIFYVIKHALCDCHYVCRTVPRADGSPGRQFPGQTVPRADGSPGRRFPGQTVPRTDSSPGRRFPGQTVPRTDSSPGRQFPGQTVPRAVSIYL